MPDSMPSCPRSLLLVAGTLIAFIFAGCGDKTPEKKASGKRPATTHLV